MPSATPDELDALYARDPDPWRFRTSAYEHAKFAATLACLPRVRYARALEVGCSIAVLGRRLAERCDRYLGIDASARALAVARAGAPGNMAFRHQLVPAEFPRGPFDLILLSEVLYFLGPHDVRRLADRAAAAAPGGDLVCVNTLASTDRELDGRTAARLFAAALGRSPDLRREEQGYLVEVFAAAGPAAPSADAR